MRALTAGARSVPDSDKGLVSHSDGGAASLLAGEVLPVACCPPRSSHRIMVLRVNLPSPNERMDAPKCTMTMTLIPEYFTSKFD